MENEYDDAENVINETLADGSIFFRSAMIMDDIFYMSSKDVSIEDVDEIAKRMNVKNTFLSKTSDVLEIEYSDSVEASWFCMRLEDFQEVEDKKFLIENRIKSIFCVSHHSNNFPFLLPHIKMMLQEYGGWIGNDGEGFQPCYDRGSVDLFNYIST